jgi:hypothetical protein
LGQQKNVIVVPGDQDGGGAHAEKIIGKMTRRKAGEENVDLKR